MKAHWEHFRHEADMGVRGVAPTAEEAFAQAALALTGVVTDVSRVVPQQAVSIHCEAPDLELMLLDWLNQLIFEMATRRMLFSRFDVRLSHDALDATAWGEEVDLRRHEPAVEVKGATFAELSVRRQDGTWLAQCVVDV